MKYCLNCSVDDFKVTVEFEAETLDEVVMNLKAFLSACGYTDRSIDSYFRGE